MSLVVMSAAREGLIRANAMEPLTRLPLSLLPTFVVPVVLFIHVVLFIRLLRRARANPVPG
jgi:hypothetical protein